MATTDKVYGYVMGERIEADNIIDLRKMAQAISDREQRIVCLKDEQEREFARFYPRRQEDE